MAEDEELSVFLDQLEYIRSITKGLRQSSLTPTLVSRAELKKLYGDAKRKVISEECTAVAFLKALERKDDPIPREGAVKILESCGFAYSTFAYLYLAGWFCDLDSRVEIKDVSDKLRVAVGYYEEAKKHMNREIRNMFIYNHRRLGKIDLYDMELKRAKNTLKYLRASDSGNPADALGVDA